MTQVEIDEVMSAVGKPGHRYFAPDSCVVDHIYRLDVLVGGTLIGSYEAGDKAKRNTLLVMAAEEPRVHLGKLAKAFELDVETVRRIRRKYEAGGIEAIIEIRRGGRERSVVGKLEARLFELFDQKVSIRKAHKLITGCVSEATVGRAHVRWKRERAARAVAEHAGNETGPVQQELVVEAAEAVEAGQGDERREQAEDERGAEPARTEAKLETVVGRGEYVQHIGTWIVLGMLEAMGVYRWLERLRADAAKRLGWRFIGAVALRLAIDAAVIAFTLGQQCVEGVRRIATPSCQATVPINVGELGPELEVAWLTPAGSS
jgi:hypothetical protein